MKDDRHVKKIGIPEDEPEDAIDRYCESSFRERADESLRKSEERYKLLVQSVTDYIYTVKVENGRTISSSHGPGCLGVTGYRPEEYEADPDLWYRMVYEEDRNTVADQGRGLLSGEVVKPVEHRIVRKDGAIRWVRNTPVPRYDEHNNLIAYDGLVSDITERKKLEEQLRHVQKMEVVGTLTGGIAHDFNNIITAIIGYASILRMKMKAGDPLAHNVEQILASTERAANLTRSLLAFSRKQIMSLKPVNIISIIKHVEKLLKTLIGEDIEFRTALSGKRLTVMADRGQIEQVLINLATNARDAMQNGGVIAIEAKQVKLGKEYVEKHGYGEPGAYAIISFTDTGTGIDKKTRERIFEPFFTTKGVGKGTGLGLSIVYGIVKQHKGYINVESEPGKGTRFDIYLPLAKSPEIEEKKKTAGPTPARGTETILMAEDDLELRNITRSILEEFGYKVIEAIDGEDAIKRFMENKATIELLLIDGVMPKKNGMEVYEEIRKIKPDVKALLLSGYTGDSLHAKGIFEGGLNFISKPIPPQEVMKKIREVMDETR